jgi:hypothetical protein
VPPKIKIKKMKGRQSTRNLEPQETTLLKSLGFVPDLGLKTQARNANGCIHKRARSGEGSRTLL